MRLEALFPQHQMKAHEALDSVLFLSAGHVVIVLIS
jgi:hypothetical protein